VGHEEVQMQGGEMQREQPNVKTDEEKKDASDLERESQNKAAW